MSDSRCGDFDPVRLEELTALLNRELYAESAGLPADEERMLGFVSLMEIEYRRAQQDVRLREFALDGLGDALNTRWNLKLTEAMDAVLLCPSPSPDMPPVRWRDHKVAERTTNNPILLRRLFASFLYCSEPLVDLIDARYAGLRSLYAEGTSTPIDIFARREGAEPSVLREMATQLGFRCRAPFQKALMDISPKVFGYDEVTLAELHALHNNRMYEPLKGLFAGRDPLQDARRACAYLGFSSAAIVLDLEDRPNKYAGAFCFPVRIPGDVRISVRPTSPHHLADMLFHEFGHAMHFVSIEPSLSFMDRYWIHSGTHETFATLFEALLGLPIFLREVMGFNEHETTVLAEFSRFKFLLAGTWLAASAAAVCDAWIQSLSWSELELRFADYVSRFTGLPAPPALARLDPFVSRTDPYPLGYVLAAVRVSNWLDALEARWGSRWWTSPKAGGEIREHMKAGGSVRFDPSWLDPSAFVRRWVDSDPEIDFET